MISCISNPIDLQIGVKAQSETPIYLVYSDANGMNWLQDFHEASFTTLSMVGDMDCNSKIKTERKIIRCQNEDFLSLEVIV